MVREQAMAIKKEPVEGIYLKDVMSHDDICI